MKTSLAALPSLLLGVAWFAWSDPARAANIEVTGIGDTIAQDSVVTLREAIVSANANQNVNLDVAVNSTGGYGDDLITFRIPNFDPPRRTITLGGTELPISANGSLIIEAPPAGVEISGSNASRVFNVAAGAIVTFTRLTIRNGNSEAEAAFGGGGISNFGTLLLDSCTLAGNTGRTGGAIFSNTDLSGVTLTIRNCTLSGNSASEDGGALYNIDGRVVIESSTLAGNTAPAKGSGVASYGDALTRTEVHNSIISGNPGTDVDFVVAFTNNSFQSQGHNLIGDGNAVGDFNQTGDVTANSNPGLSALTNNGGPTPTRALFVDSPAVNTGFTGLLVDQRGVARGQAGGIDKGAYEFNSFMETLSVTTVADEDDGTSDPFFGTGTSLREAINFGSNNGLVSAITFHRAVFAAPRKTITLSGGELHLGGTLTITAPAAGVVLNGNNTSRIFFIDGNATLTGLTLTGGNGAGTDSGLGGAIYNVGASFVLDACTLFGNDSGRGDASGSGGALYLDTGARENPLAVIRNCTFSANHADSTGGAIENQRGVMQIESCTITGNTSGFNFGSGVFSSTSALARTEVRNSIIAGNGSRDVDTLNTNSNSFQSNGYNLIGGGNATGAFAATGDVTGNSDPGLSGLAENGGRTPTWALLRTSPAFNTGDTTLTLDQRGISRPQAGADDKGAFELITESLVVTTAVDENNGTSDPVSGTGTSLREAIIFANSMASDDAITFDPAAFAAPRRTITLSGSELTLANSGALNITAPAAGVVVSGNNASRIFSVNLGARATLTGLTISGGNAGSGNGGGISNLGNLLLEGCTLSGNSATAGGAILSNTTLSGVTLTLRNCTLSGNTASVQGGALYNIDGLAVIESSTVAGNTAPAGTGGGIASFGDTLTRTEIRNSIISGNASTDVDFVAQNNNNSFQSNGHNLIGDGNATAEFNQLGDVSGNNDPGLGALADNGGKTRTRRLHASSPARDTGGASSLSQDQRGLARLFGTDVDKGAYELQSESYAFWAAYIFPAGTPAALTAFDADADGDGLANGLEQATGHNPLASDAPDTLVEFEIQGGNLILQYERSITIDPAKLFAEQSLVLQTWSSLGITYENLGPASATTELIQALIPINGEPKKFGRLRYTP